MTADERPWSKNSTTWWPQDPQDPQDRLGEFFRLVREHTVQGYFGDPAYGGNRDAAGWALLGFPGAQRGYSLDQLKPGFDGSQIPILTVNDLYRQIYARRLAPTNEGTAGAPNAAEISFDEPDASAQRRVDDD